MPTAQEKLALLGERASYTAWSTLQWLRDHPQFDRVLAHVEKVDGTLQVADIEGILRHIVGGDGQSNNGLSHLVQSLSPHLVQELQECLDAAISLQGADKGNIQLVDATGALRIVVHSGFQQDFLDCFACVRLDGSSVCARALRAGNPVTVLDVHEDPAFERYLAIATSAGFRSVQSIPIAGADRTVIGMLSVHFKLPLQSTDWRIESLRSSADRAAAVLSRREHVMPDYEQRVLKLSRRTDLNAWARLLGLLDHPKFPELLVHLERVDGTILEVHLEESLRLVS